MADSEYKLSLSWNNQDEGFIFPVLPAAIEINEQGNAKSYEIVGGGPISVIQPNSLAKISFQSYFPAGSSDPDAEPTLQPMQYVNWIMKWMNSGLPLRLIYMGEGVDLNLPVSVDGFDWKEVAGSPGDIEFSIKLQKYAFYGPKLVTVSTQPDGSAAVKQEKAKRPDERAAPTTYRIVAGDTLIRIARKTLGDESRWKEIQKLNGISDAELRRLQIGRTLKLPKRS
ncbi:LysM peptidoglycan-binding domain-containing protein [Paenibacillaceae bacterium WGS1546]|uniref:LysM peptidoglycan-binding domain-containing protein n=1 Tax=Cohnella sp. WGS1546 TaxID=3366810 RepID=UPI00372D72D4